MGHEHTWTQRAAAEKWECTLGGVMCAALAARGCDCGEAYCAEHAPSPSPIEREPAVKVGQRWRHKTCGCVLIPTGANQDYPYQHIPACEPTGCMHSSWTMHTGISPEWATLITADEPVACAYSWPAPTQVTIGKRRWEKTAAAAQAQQGAGSAIPLPEIGSRWVFESLMDGAWKPSPDVMIVRANDGPRIEFQIGSLPLGAWGPDGLEGDFGGCRYRVVPAGPMSARELERLGTCGHPGPWGYRGKCWECHKLDDFGNAFNTESAEMSKEGVLSDFAPDPEPSLIQSVCRAAGLGVWGRRPTPPKPRWTYPEVDEWDCLEDA